MKITPARPLPGPRVRTLRPDDRAQRRLALRAGVLVAAALALTAMTSRPAGAVDSSVKFGAPTVLSQQGQRLKVLLPVRSAPNDRATAASFLVRESEVPQGHTPPVAADFSVQRPAQADYVVLQSAEIVRAPQVALLISVAGDPLSPYRMDLEVPSQGSAMAPLAQAGNGEARRSGSRGASDGSQVRTRKLTGPRGDSTLPPK